MAIVGVPKETKDMEGRVGIQPDGVTELVHHGHELIVEAGAGTVAGLARVGPSSSGAPTRSSRRRTS